MAYTPEEFAAKYDALTDEQKQRLSDRVDNMTQRNAGPAPE